MKLRKLFYELLNL